MTKSNEVSIAVRERRILIANKRLNREGRVRAQLNRKLQRVKTALKEKAILQQNIF